MRQCFIHAGLPKTGTTSLQVRLRTFSEAGDGSFHYLRYHGLRFAQSRMFANLAGVNSDAIKWWPGEEAWQKFEGYISAGEIQTLVISDETLSQVGNIEDDNMNRLLLMLKKHGYELNFLLTLRSYYAWLQSLLIQQIKWGKLHKISLDAGVYSRIGGYDINYFHIAEYYKHLALAHGSPLRVFLHTGDVNGQLLEAMGIPKDRQHEQETKEWNVSFAPRDAVRQFLKISAPDTEPEARAF